MDLEEFQKYKEPVRLRGRAANSATFSGQADEDQGAEEEGGREANGRTGSGGRGWICNAWCLGLGGGSSLRVVYQLDFGLT